MQDRRSERAKRMDAERRATNTFDHPTAKEYGMWKRAPGRYDIVGIDTPEPEIEEAPPDVGMTEPEATRPEPVYEPDDWDRERKRKMRKRSDARGYSSSWYAKLRFKDDPIAAHRLAVKAMAAEEFEDLSDARAYLRDTRYDEIDHKNHRSEMETAMAIYDKMYDEYRMYEMEMMRSAKPSPEVRALADRTATLIEANAPELFRMRWDSHAEAVKSFQNYIACSETVDLVARLVNRIGGKGSRTLAREIRLFAS